MTPNDIATDINGLNGITSETVGGRTFPTFCFVGGSHIPDDQSW
jgi:hypothetical protein